MSEIKKSLPLAETLDGFLAGEPAYFCIPGHRFDRGVSPELIKRFGEKVFRYDLTETFGLDDLHHPVGALKEAQERAAALYGVRHTRFLVNGTTCGNEALVLSTAGEKDEIILARNSHSSVTSGLILSGAKPVWVMPQRNEKFGFYTGPSPKEIERAVSEHKKAKAVFIVSPTYYGTLADIKEIAGICHEFNIPLLVDEAHGSHLYFSDRFPKGALTLGADAAVMSTHKTLLSLGQTSMLHVNSSLVDIEKVDKALKLVMSSSPSYVLMTSLDAAREQMESCGEELMDIAFRLSERLRRGLKALNNIRVLENNDPSRVVFSASDLGMCGYDLLDRLYYDFGCALEMADGQNVVAVVTCGNTQEDIDRLIKAVKTVSEERTRYGNREALKLTGFEITPPEAKLTPREAYFADAAEIPLEKCQGRICGQIIAPYPPGIPIVLPGEVINRDIYKLLLRCREENINIHTDAGRDINTIKVIL